jgi:hypothetical protein
MPRRVLRVAIALVITATINLPAAAQDPLTAAAAGPGTGNAPANLSHVEGGVDVIHEGVAERATVPLMLLEGDIVRTGNGRAEIVFADGSLLHLSHETQIEFLSPSRLRLLGGRIAMRVSAATTAYAIDTPASSVILDARGEYGLTVDGRLSRLELTVARGVAELADNGTSVVVRAGEMATIAGAGGRPRLEPFNSARWDAFDRWANDRTNGFATAVSSSRLPYELRPYGQVLDQYGHWDYVAPHGYVWYPTVAASWRPYFAGSWGHTRYGWTWAGHDPWAWPTHHYGRWGYSGASWYWIPARTWGPAWVSWGFAPGYVSWCPLGWDGRPVFGFGGGRLGDHPAYWPNYSPWRAWTIVPRDHFGGRRAVRLHAVDGDRIDENTRRAMIVQNTAPPRPVGHAVPRGTLSVAPVARIDGAVRAPANGIRSNPGDGDRRGAVRRPAGNIYPPIGVTPPDANVETRRDPPPHGDAPREGVPATGAIPRYGVPTQGAEPSVPDRSRDTARTGGVRSPQSGAPYVPPPSVTRDDGTREGAVRRGSDGRREEPRTYSPPPEAARPPRDNGSSGGDRGGAVARPQGRSRESAPPPSSAPPPRAEGGRQPSAGMPSAPANGGARRRPG